MFWYPTHTIFPFSYTKMNTIFVICEHWIELIFYAKLHIEKYSNIYSYNGNGIFIFMKIVLWRRRKSLRVSWMCVFKTFIYYSGPKYILFNVHSIFVFWSIGKSLPLHLICNDICYACIRHFIVSWGFYVNKCLQIFLNAVIEIAIKFYTSDIYQIVKKKK